MSDMETDIFLNMPMCNLYIKSVKITDIVNHKFDNYESELAS